MRGAAIAEITKQNTHKNVDKKFDRARKQRRSEQTLTDVSGKRENILMAIKNVE